MSDERLSLVHKTRMPTCPQSQAAPLLILLHGYGSDCVEIMNLAPMIDPRFLLVAPRARHKVKSGGFGWFHLNWTSFGPAMFAQEPEAARRALLGFIEEAKQTYPVDPNQVYVLGFNQGAILSLSIALTEPSRIAGAISLSGCILPDVAEYAKSHAPLNGIPLMVLHGTADTLFPVKHARATRDCLAGLPLMLTYREYPVAHELTADMAMDVADWLQFRLDSQHAPFAHSV